MIINMVGMLLHIYETFTATAAEKGQEKEPHLQKRTQEFRLSPQQQSLDK